MMFPKISLAGREVMIEVCNIPTNPALCECRLYFQGIESAEFPDAATMEKLAEKYLRGGYEETWRLVNYLAFKTNRGFTEGERVAFLAAVCAATAVTAE